MSYGVLHCNCNNNSYAGTGAATWHLVMRGDSTVSGWRPAIQPTCHVSGVPSDGLYSTDAIFVFGGTWNVSQPRLHDPFRGFSLPKPRVSLRLGSRALTCTFQKS